MATYASYKELQDSVSAGTPLELKDVLKFPVKGRHLIYEVASRFLWVKVGLNSLIFTELGIPDKRNFCTNSYGYEARSYDFPECATGDFRALTMVALDLFKECEKFSEEEAKKEKDPYPDSLYKLGDKVTIREECLPGTDSNDYLFGFAEKMFDYGGQLATITGVYKEERDSHKVLCTDSYRYAVNLDEGIYSWSAEMFEETGVLTKKVFLPEVLFTYKDVSVLKNPENLHRAPLTVPFKVGDRVLWNGDEKVILGFSPDSSTALLYAESGHGGSSQIFTEDGTQVMLDMPRGWYYNISDLAPVSEKSSEPTYIEWAIKPKQEEGPTPHKRPQLQSEIVEIKLTIPKRKHTF